ncbi:GNAT family N-acetyltransferase [Lactococcus lactis]|jgi:putative acetyltransferase|uniref:GNAT family N-acetyltransferase n=3 Tax=Lactococcus lactis TaxID=1358 RepID=A0A7X1SE57_9LACT|nr:GNAT family N-acetyltransferase [Lactococcus lactis]MBU5243088.1 GNAT family N-acetyltransferase [Lactococcus lactis]MDT2857679.1 GNAT family N-acetyltransferase [Lactococcus lactis]MDT2859349.1 GNAT family N-acetyltransferase [Lactococcus lactis]MDT2863055.1 GNAT family N-acetyltransferase [Lactococcus lactis]MDT2867553.1 GNAT family N-acetyltransferase [Lactococcus lactis]
MNEISKVKRSQVLIEKLVNLWENSVKASHLFLSNKEIEEIKKYVPQALREIEHLIVETDKTENPIAFMGIYKNKLEMLFISPVHMKTGLGRKLIEEAIENYSVNELVVNEQNPKAKGFYEHLGFKVYKRNPIDEQGNQYPILFMHLG